MVEAAGLEILLEGGEILLSGGKVAGLEIGGELVEGLSDGVGSGGRSGRGLRNGFLQGGEIGLRGREIAGLEVLAELVEGFLVRGTGGTELVGTETAA